MAGRPPTERQRSMQEYSSEQRVTVLRGFYNRLVLIWRLIWDRRTGIFPKLIPLFALIYLISPIDLMPIVPFGVFAGLDDIGVIMLAVTMFIQAAPPDVVQEHLRELGEGAVSQRGEVIDGSADVLDE